MTVSTLASEYQGQVGVDYIGVGVGALIINDQDQLLMTLRGQLARNERGTWEIPGGKLEYGETLEASLKREMMEELGVEIEVLALFHVCDHLLPTEKQHWVSPTYLCRIKSGEATVMEPGKCEELRWFSLEETEAVPISIVTQHDIAELKKRGGIAAVRRNLLHT